MCLISHNLTAATPPALGADGALQGAEPYLNTHVIL